MKHLYILLFFLCASLGAQEYKLVNIAPGPIITVEKIDSSDGDMSNMFGDKGKGKGSIDSKISGSKTRSLLKVDMCRLVKGCDPKAAGDYVKTVLAGKKIEVSSEQDAENRDIYIVDAKEYLSKGLASWSVEYKEAKVNMVSSLNNLAAPSNDKLDIDFAGLYLGCDKQTALAFMSKCKLTYKGESSGKLIYTYDRFPNLKNTVESTLTIWNDKLLTLEVMFKPDDNGGDFWREQFLLFDAVKDNINKKYGVVKQKTKDAAKYGEAYCGSYHGIDISLHCGGRVELSFTHNALQKKYEESQKAAAANKLGKF